VTTFNEELPDENWRIPDPNPSAVSTTTVDNRDNDYHRLVDTVERHTRCSPAYCLKHSACRMQIWFSKAITRRNRNES
jgi:hypothetical protein